MSQPFDPSCLPEMLPLYYKSLYPVKLMFKWLSYGRKDKSYIRNREWSFILKDDVYLRYRSYGDPIDLEKSLVKDVPFKIDIGAVYNGPPKTHRRNAGFEAQERELVFDVDLTDYDDVRKCCSGASMCGKCWRFMIVAVRVLDRALREDFGFEHILYVYSGRRGVHCWVADQSARQLDSTARAAIASYLSVVAGGGETSKKKVKLPGSSVSKGSKDFLGSRRLHPSLSRALDSVQEQFVEIAEEQGYFDNEDSLTTFLELFDLPAEDVEGLKKGFKQSVSGDPTSEQWDWIEENLRRYPTGSLKIAEVLFQYCYPRLDVNVTTGLNHLLKSPFSVHPKTGKISVPFSIEEAETFDYEAVPRIDQLYQEVSSLKSESAENEPMETEEKPRPKPVDYRKTSLKHSIEVFESFVNALPADRCLETKDGFIEF